MATLPASCWGSDLDQLIEWIVLYGVFLFSVTCHEAGHAWAALRGGDTTAYLGGQVTLDPRPHIAREPFGTVIVPLIGLAMSGFPLGWASAPYNQGWAYAFPKRAAWMALAGPGANFALVLVSGFLIRFGTEAGVFDPYGRGLLAVVISGEGAAPFWSTAAMFVSALFGMNLLLMVLNLIPVPPLDGSAAIGLFLSDETSRRWQAALAQSGLGIFGLLIAFMSVRYLYWPVYNAALDVVFAGL